MRTQTPHISRRRIIACIAVAVAVALLGCAPRAVAGHTQTAKTPSYGWPVKPFHRQHAVRGFFGDPRIAEGGAGTTHSFHFGIDVSCPDGTAVYATLSGRIVLDKANPETVTIAGTSDDVDFSYWHVVPTVHDGQAAVAYRTVLGHVAKGWAHVHFAESHDGVYVNPLRPGAIGPYSDPTRPRLKNLRVEHRSHVLSHVPSSGRFDLVVEASDTTPIAIAGRWHDKPVTPALIRWRVPGTNAWHTAMDVRWTIPSNDLFTRTFATWTRQNNPWGQAGRYRFYLAHDLGAAEIGPGATAVEVQATDTRGNTTTRRFTLPGVQTGTARLVATVRTSH